MRVSSNTAAGWALVLVPVAFVGVYWPTIHELVRQWLGAPDYSHGILIFPLALYLVWERREELKQIDIRPDWRALPVLLIAIVVFVMGELGAELFTTRIAMLTTLFGLTWLLGGGALVKLLRFPMAFLLLMLPLPGFIYRNITFPLQLFSSVASVEVLHTLGITAHREGNIIDIGITQLQVVEACSGLRYILPLLTFGVLIAYFGQKVFWKRLVLVAATLPFSILGNVFRIGGTAVIATRWGNKAAESFFHSFSGWLVFMFCAALFLIFNFLLKRLPGAPRKTKPPPATQKRETRRVITWPSVAVALAAILITRPVVGYLGAVPPVPLKAPLEAFPLKLGDWTGSRSRMDPKIWAQVGGQDYVIIDYLKNGELPINFYVVYYEYQRKAGDFVHSPRLCLPGAGWHVDEDRVRTLSARRDEKTTHRGLKLNELVISKPGARQLSYFWYQGRGRNFTNEFAAKFYMVWDGIWRRRTDGALVRVVTPLPPGRTMAEARHILDGFALKASMKLEAFLP